MQDWSMTWDTKDNKHLVSSYTALLKYWHWNLGAWTLSLRPCLHHKLLCTIAIFLALSILIVLICNCKLHTTHMSVMTPHLSPEMTRVQTFLGRCFSGIRFQYVLFNLFAYSDTKKSNCSLNVVTAVADTGWLTLLKAHTRWEKTYM